MVVWKSPDGSTWMEKDGGQLYFVRRVPIEDAARLTFEHLPERSLAMLTKQEEKVLLLVCQGKSNKEIAAAMNLCERTVKFHIAGLLMKANVRSRMHLARVFNVKAADTSPQ